VLVVFVIYRSRYKLRWSAVDGHADAPMGVLEDAVGVAPVASCVAAGAQGTLSIGPPRRILAGRRGE
jgi:hypothetical protein